MCCTQSWSLSVIKLAFHGTDTDTDTDSPSTATVLRLILIRTDFLTHKIIFYKLLGIFSQRRSYKCFSDARNLIVIIFKKIILKLRIRQIICENNMGCVAHCHCAPK